MATQRVLVVGATGHLGHALVPALRARKKDVTVLLRPETAKSRNPDKRDMVDGFKKHGAIHIEGSMEDTASLERACRGIDAVISCVTGPQLPHQLALATAAKKAGVQRFFPSEFGVDVTQLPKGSCLLFDWKRDLHRPLEEMGLAVTYVYSNGFQTYWAASLGQLGLMSPPKEEIQVYGKGNVKMAFVGVEDIAAYTTFMLDEPKTEKREVAITPPGNVYTQEELIALWEKLSGAKLKRRSLSAAELDQTIQKLAGQPDKMLEMIYLQIARAAWIDGLGAKRRPDVLEATQLFPQHKPVTVEAFLKRFLH